jgi:ABC-type transport system involved in multi-copper enzyme maturation permease subunit
MGSDMTLGFTQLSVQLLLPFVVFLLTFRAVVSPRTAGSLKLTLNLPLTRREILLGKVLGRSAGICAVVVTATVTLTVLGTVRFGFPNPLRFASVAGLTLLYVFVLVTISVSASAMSSSLVRVVGIVFTTYVLAFIFWDQIADSLYGGFTGTPVDRRRPPADGLFFLLDRLAPESAYNVLTNWLLGVGNSADSFNFVLPELASGSTTDALVVEAVFRTGSEPFYLHPAFAVGILLLWIAIPAVVASHRFRRADLT